MSDTDKETSAATPGETFTPTAATPKPAAAEAKPKKAARPKPTAKSTKAEDKGSVTVTCAVASGRRRGGRRWEAGATSIPAEELTEELEAALAADPMFTVTKA